MRAIAALLATSLFVVVTAAQQRPAFEVASARVALNAIGFGGLLGPDGKDPIQFSNVVTEQRVHLVLSLYSLVQRALRLRAHQLVAPDWTNELWIEIRATIPPDATPQQVPEMLHGLLVERFGYFIQSYRLTAEGRCPDCATAIPGRWAASFDGQISSTPFVPRRIV